MEKAAIDIVKSLARLSELSIFELRGDFEAPPCAPGEKVAAGFCFDTSLRGKIFLNLPSALRFSATTAFRRVA